MYRLSSIVRRAVERHDCIKRIARDWMLRGLWIGGCAVSHAKVNCPRESSMLATSDAVGDDAFLLMNFRRVAAPHRVVRQADGGGCHTASVVHGSVARPQFASFAASISSLKLPPRHSATLASL